MFSWHTCKISLLRTLDDFNMHLDFFRKKRENDIVNDSVIGGKKIFTKLIVIDNVSGIADKFNDFANVLTVP